MEVGREYRVGMIRSSFLGHVRYLTQLLFLNNICGLSISEQEDSSFMAVREV